MVGELHVNAAVGPVSKGTKRVRPVCRVQVVTGRDGVLAAEGRAALTLRQRVLLEVVVPHQPGHRLRVLNLYNKIGKFVIYINIKYYTYILHKYYINHE